MSWASGQLPKLREELPTLEVVEASPDWEAWITGLGACGEVGRLDSGSPSPFSGLWFHLRNGLSYFPGGVGVLCRLHFISTKAS